MHSTLVTIWDQLNRVFLLKLYLKYPNDGTDQGRQLRLKQQFFFVSASLQDMIRQLDEK